MSNTRTPRVTLRLHCCRCGRIQRFTALARAAFALADDLLARPCGGELARGGTCASRDRRLELRPVEA